MQKCVIIRFAVRSSKIGPQLDLAAARKDLLEQLVARIRTRYGDDTEVEITEGQTSEIRMDGKFHEKGNDVRAFVSELLGEVMEGFDSSAYAA